MNRVQGDYFETLLYKIFVSIDEHTNVAEVSVSMSCERIFFKDCIYLFLDRGGGREKERERNINV